jgi:4-hydroxy-tetrahydrodipicolinate synthase
MVKPFTAEGTVDFGRAAELAEYLVANGSDGVVVTGTTGEAPTLSDGEKLALYSTVVEAVGSKASVLAGTGTYDTHHSIELSVSAGDVGVDGILAVTPYYSKPPQAGIIAHFNAIADATDKPVIVYNIPGRTAKLIEAETLAELASHPNIVGTKDSVEDTKFTSQCRQLLPDDFLIYSGADDYTLPMLAVGGYGVISVPAHFVGPQIKRMIEAFVAGDVVEAERLHRGLVPIFEACFVEPSPMPTKAGLNEMWQYVGEPRLPLVSASDDTMRRIFEATGLAQKL